MAKTINDVLEAARQDTGRVQLRLKAVDMAILVKGVVTANQALAHNKDQVIKLESVKKSLVFGDQQRLSEVVDNLINNAIKYSPPGKEIHVHLKETKTAAVVEVLDFGPGLTKDDLKNLFRKFTSLSAQPTGGETSSGLGLSIVKHLVDAHRGKIEVTSKGPGKGTSFIVEIPKSES
ncbi:HAMP domain-containing histidine kinase [Antarcticibacterium sp. 1MA-6-2]|uniref:sensor histidine kinase n=1 Tax=Antarcticibacterium sp. 1MA-6-2 TaxID=2908210 RepID=UPI001F2B239A|nr:HAMP domain-containing sensor histidine kinase [Antarcticibacterium sp. 1MA-6-2]UJH90845.1 HAMP domain-containing histidine kinase [Antarcticibacterium sp. 1MA-6-2]